MKTSRIIAISHPFTRLATIYKQLLLQIVTIMRFQNAPNFFFKYICRWSQLHDASCPVLFFSDIFFRRSFCSSKSIGFVTGGSGLCDAVLTIAFEFCEVCCTFVRPLIVRMWRICDFSAIRRGKAIWASKADYGKYSDWQWKISITNFWVTNKKNLEKNICCWYIHTKRIMLINYRYLLTRTKSMYSIKSLTDNTTYKMI